MIHCQRACSSSTVRSRNFVVALSQPCTGGRPNGAMSTDGQRPSDPAEPGGALPAAHEQPQPDDGDDQAGHARRARPSTRPALGGRPESSSARASTGSPSLAKLLNRPDTSSETDVRDREKPHEEFIA